MPSTRKFYRSVFTVEVLSEGPLPSGMSLNDIRREIVTGGCSGQVDENLNQEVNGSAMVTLLAGQGADPSFFNLTDTGEDLDDE